jgi:hypothetical protein
MDAEEYILWLTEHTCMSAPSKESEQHAASRRHRTAGGSGGIRRRGFLRTSAAAVSMAGLGLSGGERLHGVAGATTQTPELPSFVEFVPADISLVGTDGTVTVTSADIQPTLELFTIEEGDSNNSQTTPLQFEPLVLTSFLIGLEFSRLGELGLGDALPVVSTASEPPEEEIPEFPTDRLVSVGDAVVTVGSYDTDEIAAAIEESDLTESDTPGVFVGDDPVFGGTQQDNTVAVTWSPEHVISGPTVELVAAVAETAQGERARLFEQNDDIARQLTDAGAGDMTGTVFSTDGQVQPDTDDDIFDYTPLTESQVQGYTHSLTVDAAGPSVTATTVFSHTSTDNVDEEVLSGVGSEASESTLSRDGRFVTVEALYTEPLSGGDDSGDGSDDGSGDESDSGSDDGGTSGGSDGESEGSDGESDSDDGNDSSADGDGGDGGNSDDGGADEDGGDGGNSDDGGADGDGGDDGGDGIGPGFGLLSALAGLGGAGYLLSRRLGDDTGDRE